MAIRWGMRLSPKPRNAKCPAITIAVTQEALLKTLTCPWLQHALVVCALESWHMPLGLACSALPGDSRTCTCLRRFRLV